MTGIDFSERSIDYARKSAQRRNLNLTYRNQDYLQMKLDKRFDYATMIYCDYGALSTTDREVLLRNVYQHLQPGGKFLLDVFTMAKYAAFVEGKTWEFCKDGGFWRSEPYMALHHNCRFSNDVTLEQVTIVSACEPVSYYLWNTYFTKERLIAEVQAAGFEVCAVLGDVAGRAYCEEGETMAILLEK